MSNRSGPRIPAGRIRSGSATHSEAPGSSTPSPTPSGGSSPPVPLSVQERGTTLQLSFPPPKGRGDKRREDFKKGDKGVRTWVHPIIRPVLRSGLPHHSPAPSFGRVLAPCPLLRSGEGNRG